MTNNILALIIIAVSLTVTFSRNPSKGMLWGGLAIIGAILVFVSASSAQLGDFGPAIGVGAFVGTLGLFYVYRMFKK